MANKETTGKLPLKEIVNDNSIASAVLSKLNTSPEVANVIPQLQSLPIVSMSTYDKIKSNNDIIDLFPDTELCIQILVSSILSPNDLVTPALTYTADDIKLPPSVKQTLLDVIKQHVDLNYELTNNLPNMLREALFTKGAYIEAIIPEASLDDIISQYEDMEATKTTTTLDSDINRIILNKEIGLLGDINSRKVGYNHNYLTGTPTKYTMDEDLMLQLNTLTTNNTRVEKQNIRVTEDDMFISITDNPSVLTIKDIKKTIISKQAKQKIKNRYGITTDEDKKTTKKEEEILDNIFKQSNKFINKPHIIVNTIDNASRESIGKPLVFKLPVESVIPVHITNDPSNHLGYFVLLNDNGVPLSGSDLSTDSTESAPSVLQGTNPGSVTMADTLISKARSGLFGMVKEDVKLKSVEEIYCKILEDMIKKKLANGAYGELADIKDTYEVYKIMFHRALKAQHTKLLFLPAELVAFYAFDYRENGTGRSLLEKSSILHSVRAILLFSKIMGQLKRSVDITKYTVTLPEQTQDPQGEMERTKSELLKSFILSFPVGMSKTTDLVDWIHRLGMVLNFKHPGLPDMEVDIQTMGRDYIAPEDDLTEFLREQTIMSYGLTPETVTASFSPDFATTITSNNLLTAKRTSDLQRTVNLLTTEHVRKILTNDMHIRTIIKDLVETNLSEIKTFISKDKNDESSKEISKLPKDKLIEYITETVITVVKATLPKVETTEAQTMNKAFEEYKNTIEPALDILFSSEALNQDMTGELSNRVDTIKSIFKTVLLKKWFNDNGYLPEIGDFFSRDDDGKPVFNILDEYLVYVEMLEETLLPYMRKMKKFKEKTDQKIQDLDEEQTDTGDNNTNTPPPDDGNNPPPEDPNAQGDQQQDPNQDPNAGGEDPNAGGGEPEDPFGGDDPFADNNGAAPDDGGQTPEPAPQEQDNNQDNGQQPPAPEPDDNQGGNEPEPAPEPEDNDNDNNNDNNQQQQ